MKNKDGLCQAEVKKNLVLVEIGEPLTMPLATLNRNCKFNAEWNRLQKVWHRKKVICPCGVEFSVSKGRSKYCSKECSKIQAEIKLKAYNESPERRARTTAYNQKPEVIARLKAYAKSPEVLARRKAYSQRPEVKARALARQRTPEAKAKARARAMEYYKRPEVKARRIANYEKNRERILQRHREKYAINKGLEIKYYNIFELLEQSY